MVEKIISATIDEVVIGASKAKFAYMLIRTINENIKPAENIHWYCLEIRDRKHMIEVPRNIAVKSLIWVFLPSPSRKTILRELADSSGDKSHLIAIIAKTNPSIKDKIFAVFISLF